MGSDPTQWVMSPISTSPLASALSSLHYAYPICVFGYYVSTVTIALLNLRSAATEGNRFLRRTFLSVLLVNMITYFCQVLALLIEGLIQRQVPSNQSAVIGSLSCILVFGLQFSGLWDKEKPLYHPFVGSFGIALIFEPTVAALSVVARPRAHINSVEVVDMVATAMRCIALITGLIIFANSKCRSTLESGTDAEQQALLNKDGQGNEQAKDSAQNDYGSTIEGSSESSSTEESIDANKKNNKSSTTTAESPWERRERLAREQMEKRLKEKGNWVTYAKSFLVFYPYIWPVNKRTLQARVVCTGICLLSTNAINMLIPRQLGLVVDSLSGANALNPWVQVIIFAILKLIASDSGLELLRYWLWIPVEFYSFEAISTAAYSHVLRLSSDFHDSKGSSDIMTAMQAGSSISNMLETVCFQAVPMLIDMVVAFTYLSVTFGAYEGFISIATACVFLVLAQRMIAGLRNARRSQISAYFEEQYVRQAGIQGWTTVTSFNQVTYEETRYATAVRTRVEKSQWLYLSYITSYAFQYLVLLCGLLAGAFLAVYKVTRGEATAGQFMMLLTYWGNMVSPLGFFARLGKNIAGDLTSAEQLLDIMQTKPSVVSKEGAPALRLTRGEVEFDAVHFSYDKKKDIVKNVSFRVEPGTTVAFVGATGAGKSTILKLLDRFYDVTQGAIRIDGQDVRDVELGSLRGHIGVVPQAPILFDDTIINNVRYAKLTATDEEVFAACKAASIHDQVLGFSDGYQTRVGERGVKLSGGELQRVAIARAILKQPSIVLLDEATSAVDTETEHKIQEALRMLTDNRTTFVVAHRLSTIMNADRIVVIGDGAVVEEGTHDGLIAAGGKYAELWNKQVFVRPKEKDSKDKDAAEGKPASKAPTLVDDSMEDEASLGSEVGQPADDAEDGAAKTKDDEAKAKVKYDDDASPETPEQSPTKPTTSSHKKETSRLNPDAPTFTPRSKTPSLAPSSPAKLDRSADGAFESSPCPSPVPVLPRVQAPPRIMPTLPMMPHMPYMAAPFVMLPAPYTIYQPHPMAASAGSVHNVNSRASRVFPSIEEDEEIINDGSSAKAGSPVVSARDVSASFSSARNQNQHGKENHQRRNHGVSRPANKMMALKHPRYSRRVQSKSEPSANSSACSPPPDSAS